MPTCISSQLGRICVLLAIGVSTVAGCKTYRIEHRRRPAYYERLVEGPLPSQVTLDDGTVVMYQTPAEQAAALGAAREAAQAEGAETGEGDDGASKPFRLREEHDDGTVTIRAFLPVHVVANTLNCLRLEEYRLLWDQLLSEKTKRTYEREGKGYEDFERFCRKHRIELAKMLNRMRIGLSTYEVVVEDGGNGTIVCRFWPETAKLFRFKRVEIERNGFWLKLVMIR